MIRLNEEFVVEYTYNSNAIAGNALTLRETDMVLRGLTIDKKPYMTMPSMEQLLVSDGANICSFSEKQMLNQKNVVERIYIKEVTVR